MGLGTQEKTRAEIRTRQSLVYHRLALDLRGLDILHFYEGFVFLLCRSASMWSEAFFKNSKSIFKHNRRSIQN